VVGSFSGSYVDSALPLPTEYNGILGHSVVLTYGSNGVDPLVDYSFSSGDRYICADIVGTAGVPKIPPLCDYKIKRKVTGSFTNLFFVSLFTFLFDQINDKILDWENHATDVNYENAMITKNFLFTAVNNFFLLFYIVFFKFGTLWGVTVEPCTNECMSDIQIQIIVLFLSKTVVGQFVEIAKPTAKIIIGSLQFKLSICLNKDKKSLGQEDVQIAQAVEGEAPAGDDDAPALLSVLERQLATPEFGEEEAFDDYNELAVQLGFVTLFASAFPLAPLLALMNNVCEIRFDAWKIMDFYRRNRCELDDGIGSWHTIFEGIAMAAVATNAILVAIVGTYYESVGSGDDVPEAMQHDYLWRLGQGRLWAVAILIEHAGEGTHSSSSCGALYWGPPRCHSDSPCHVTVL